MYMQGYRDISSDPARQGSLIYPTVLTKVPDLQEISAVSAAIAIWSHVNVADAVWQFDSSKIQALMMSAYTDGRIQNSDGWLHLCVQLVKLVDELPLPNTIAKYIAKLVEKLRYQIQDWVAYHHRSIFFSNGSDYHLYHHIPSFTWYPDGTVDNKTTALNLLSSDRLSNLERYKFLCTYCLEDELAKLAPELIFKNIVELVEFDTHPLIFYWNRYFRNELHLIPVTGTLSVDNFMFQHARVDNWWAKEYFFDRLNSAEKVPAAISLIDRFGAWCQKLILMKLDESERTNVYMQRAVQILSNYSKTASYTGEILSTWFDIRHLINADQFVSIFMNLLQSRNVDAILPELWSSACDDLKYHLFTHNDYQSIEKIFELQEKAIVYGDTENEILFTILSEVDMDLKKAITEKPFFRKYCDTLFQRDQLQMFGRLVKECSTVDELKQFRQQLVFNSAIIKEIGISCFLKKNTILDDFLQKLLPSHPDLIREYKEDLFISNTDRLFEGLRFDVSKMDLIMADESLTEDFKTEFKKKVIFSSVAISALQSRMVHNRLKDVKRLVDNYLTSNEDKKLLKKRLVTNFEDRLVSMFSKSEEKLQTIQIQNLLAWCLEDEASFLEYKSSLRVDFIFDRLLTNAVFLRHDPYRLSNCIFVRRVDFVNLERFLNWYFEFPGKVKEYKLRRIDSYNQIPMITSLLQKKDDSYLRIVMKWFFEDDVVEIVKFRKKYCLAGKIAFAI